MVELGYKTPSRQLSLTEGLTDREGVDMTIVPEAQSVVYGLSCACHESAGIRYVGLTEKGADARLIGHKKRAASSYISPVYNWIRKHGTRNIETTVLERCESMSDLRLAERAWIQRLRDDGRSLLNITDGGEGIFKHSPTPEQRAAISKALTGRKVPAEQIARRVASRAGYTHSVETREKMSAAQTGHLFSKRGAESPNFGRSPSKETRERIRQSLTGTKWSQERLDRGRPDGVGEGNSGSKLTEANVLDILARLKAGESQPSIALTYGVNRMTINRINTGKSWSYLRIAA